MGQPDCDRCGEQIPDSEPMVQVVCHDPLSPLEDEDVEHLGYYHRRCWDALRGGEEG